MNEGTRLLVYRVEVRAEMPTSGTGRGRPLVLGVSESISPKLAVRWLRGEARKIADQLDASELDCAAKLRAWSGSSEEERAAREYIKSGFLMIAEFPAGDCTYSLAAWPVEGADAEPDPSPPELVPHRIGGLAAPLHVLAENPGR